MDQHRIEHALGYLFLQRVTPPDLEAHRQLRHGLAQCVEPARQQRLPQAELAAQREHAPHVPG